MVPKKLRVGILGVAGISSKAAIAISSSDSGCVVGAVASRSLEKAEHFIEEFFSENSDVEVRPFGGQTGYSDMLQCDIIDAVYIPLPVAVKKSWVIKALDAGKHVVLEKPTALTANDYKDMLAAAYARKKFVLDGTMFPHHKRTRDFMEIITDESKVGTVDRVECNFSFMGGDSFDDSNIRASKKGDPQGCIGDLGWYCVRFALTVFGKLGSKPISSEVLDWTMNKHGVPVDVTCIVRFEHNRVLWFQCGFRTGFRQRFDVCGSKKFLSINDLVLPAAQPTSFLLKSSDLTKYDLITFHEQETVETESGPVQEVLLWQKFGKICIGMDEDSSDPTADGWPGGNELMKEANEWAAVSLVNQMVVDSLMESIEKGTSVDL